MGRDNLEYEYMTFEERDEYDLTHNLKSSWYERYSRYVNRMTAKYEALNKNAETIITNLSPEELKKYNEPKKESVHKLKFKGE